MAPTGAMTNIAVGHGGLERIPSSLASHSFMPEGREAMLQNCLTVETEFQHQHDSIEFQVSVQATDVGHRVPTGFIDRHLILVVEALDDQEQHVTLIEGPTLPLAAGTLHQQPGHLFAKLLVDPSGTGPQPFWRAGMTTNDTRLMPDQAEHFTFRFPQETATIKTKLVYRPFWETVAQQKGWPTEDLSVFAKTTKVNRPIRTSH